MTIVPLAEVKARFSAYIKKIQNEPVIMTKNGRPVAIMMSISDKDDLERILLAASPKFQALLDKAERRIQETGGMSHEEVWTQVEGEAKS